MTITRRRWAVTVLGIGLAMTAAALEVPLTFERFPEPGEAREGYLPGGYVMLEWSLKAPDGEWKLPALTGRAPVYAPAMLGGKRRLLVLDGPRADGAFFDKLYFDANANGDLTDDPAIDPLGGQGRGNYVQFPTLEIAAAGGAPYFFRLITYWGGELPEGGLAAKDLKDKLVVYLASACLYRGEFTLGGATYRFALADGNANGTFDDLPRGGEDSRSRWPGDALFLTSEKEIAYTDMNYVGDFLLLKDQPLRLRLDTAGKKMHIDPATDGLVTVSLSMEVDRMALHTTDGEHCVILHQPGRKVKIPAGSYRLTHYRTTRKDAEGDEWVVAAAFGEETPFASVADGGTLTFGEPFLVTAVVPDQAYEAFAEGTTKEVPLQLLLEGSAKERVTDLRHVSGTMTKHALDKSGSRPKEPAYRIVKADGELVASGSFRYG